MSKILVTGGMGFVGFNLVKRLAQMGEDVIALGKSERHKEEFEELGVTMVIGSVTDVKLIDDIMEGRVEPTEYLIEEKITDEMCYLLLFEGMCWDETENKTISDEALKGNTVHAMRCETCTKWREDCGGVQNEAENCPGGQTMKLKV